MKWIFAVLLFSSGLLMGALNESAVDFDGTNDYVSIPDNAAYDVSAVTIEMWAKWAGTGTQFLIGKNFEELEIHTHGDETTGRLRFIPATTVWLDTEEGTFLPGAWHHIAMIYDPSQSLAKCYIDGEEKTLSNAGSNPLSTAIPSSAVNLYLGKRSSNQYYFNGLISDVRIWNDVRTQTEIYDNMSADLTGSEAGLIAFFPLDENSGSTVNDGSATNNDGSISGAVWTSFGTLEFSGGSGTSSSPWQIRTAQNLSNLRNYLGSGNSGKYFKMMNDIDLTDYLSEGGAGYAAWSTAGWLPIGDNTNNFYGKFEGNHLTISNLSINRTTMFQGLFGKINGATILNLNVSSANFANCGWHSGILCGTATNALIRNCHFSGTMNTSKSLTGGICGVLDGVTLESSSYTGTITSTNGHIGGICGESVNSSIKNNFANVNISGIFDIGGLIGSFSNGNQVDQCYSVGTIEGTSSIGGFIGASRETTDLSTVSNSFSRVNITLKSGGTSSSAAAFCGQLNPGDNRTFTDCYATGWIKLTSASPELQTNNGFINLLGEYAGIIISNCYWDAESSGSSGPGALTTAPIAQNSAQMKKSISFLNAGWDFEGETSNGEDDIWGMNPDVNDGFPFLMWTGETHNPPADFSGGSGTELSPWQISSAEDLNTLHHYCGNTHSDKYFILTQDIDLSAYLQSGGAGYAVWINSGWEPVGTSASPFYAHFDGNEKSISGLSISRGTTSDVGLFGAVDGSAISDLSISGTTISGKINVGVLAGNILNGSAISNCSADADLSGEIQVGGLAGNISNSSISSSFALGDVSAFDRSGGFCGYSMASTISNCYSRGNVTRPVNESGIFIGGFLGFSDENTSVSNCYSTGSVIFIGESPEIRTNLGFNSVNQGTFSNCFWDTERSGASTNPTTTGVTGKTTAQLNTQSTFTDAGWDYSSVWKQSPFINSYYPAFQRQESGAAGSGTAGDPYLIDSYDDLVTIADVAVIWDEYFKQVADISFPTPATESFSPIGNSSTAFSGQYNGQNYSISNLSIDNSTLDYAGLFGYVNGGTLANITLANVSISADEYAAALCGSAVNATISGCGVSSGELSGSAIPLVIAGSFSNSDISNSYYNFQAVTLNDSILLKMGALYSDQYNAWLSASKNIAIGSHYTKDGSNRYEITNATGMKNILFWSLTDDYSFILKNDIDLAGMSNFHIPWFAATFDGNYKKLSHISINYPIVTNVGFFAENAGGTIQNLTLESVSIAGYENVGALAGKNHGTISNCSISGSIAGYLVTGGLVGLNEG
ncbi:MAG TPA: hypothetical protein ENN84_00940, partial [Candidatus Marinimicrobia bacterium]|nr:hypothetical protein [Candidatus Neomarinimicrobiota bacterium]